jgi:hypothetical protein
MATTVDPAVAPIDPGVAAASRRVTLDPAAHLPPASPTPAWRTIDRLAAVGFVVVLFVPLVLFGAGIRPALIDNRPLLTPPPVSGGALLDTAFYAALDKFVADNVALRPVAVRLRALVDARVLGGSSNPEVIRGTGDWLFSRAELAPHCSFSAEQLAGQLGRAAASFGGAEQTFRALVVPDKHVIYPDRLRSDLGLAPACTESRRATLRAWLASHPTIGVDGWTPLLGARAAEGSSEGLYYPQDSHWTPAGAVAGIRELVRSLDPALWDDAEVVVDGTMRRDQELARQMGISSPIDVPRLRTRPGMTVKRTTILVAEKLAGAAAIYEYRTSGAQRVLPGRTAIVYDSFFGITMPLVAPFFADSVWIHTSDLGGNPQLARELGPFDRVIYERVERGIYDTDAETLLRPLVRTSP